MLMSDFEDSLEKETKQFILDICELLHYRGYDKVALGAIMRLMGVEEAKAFEFDDHFIEIPENFDTLVEQFGGDEELTMLEDVDDSDLDDNPTIH